MRRLLPWVLLLAALAGCANSTPEIRQVFNQVTRTWNPETSRWEEALSVFVQVADADGVEVVTRLHVLQDDAHVYWTLTPDTWARVDRPGETWLGGAHLLPPGDRLPTGAWRVQVVTKAGLLAELGFALPPEAPGTPPARTSAVHLRQGTGASGNFRVEGFATDYLVWAYGSSGELLGQRKLVDDAFTLASIVPGLGQEAKVRSLVLYSFDKQRGEGLAAGPFLLK